MNPQWMTATRLFVVPSGGEERGSVSEVATERRDPDSGQRGALVPGGDDSSQGHQQVYHPVGGRT